MKEQTKPSKKLEHVQTVRLSPAERKHLETLQRSAQKQENRRVPFNEIMIRGLMSLRSS